MKKILSALAVIAMIASQSTVAADWGPDFSADMVLTNPKNTSQSTTAQYAASKGRTALTSRIPKSRADKQGLGRVQVDIVNPYLGAVWRVFPDSKKYYERKGDPVTDLPPPPMPDDAAHACNAVDEVKCTNQGEETINGRKTEKWEIVTETDKDEVTATLWFDVEIGIPIRELVPGKMMRELNNVKVGTQPDDRFTLPAGYEKIEPEEK